METEELTDRLHEAEDNAVVRFRRMRPFRFVEIETRARARQIVRVARELAEEFLYSRAQPAPAYARPQACRTEQETIGTYRLNFQDRLIEALYGNRRA